MKKRLYDTNLRKRVASLFCQEIGSREIGRILQIEESEILEILDLAEEEGIFDYRPIFRQIPKDALIFDFVQSQFETLNLRNRFYDVLEGLNTVFAITPSPSEMFETYHVNAKKYTSKWYKYRSAERLSIARVARLASEILTPALLDGDEHTVGVNWGAVVKAVIDRIVPRPMDLIDTDHTLTWVALFGDLNFHTTPQPHDRREDAEADDWDPTLLNSNDHVSEIAKRFGKRGRAVRLAVPGIVPARVAAYDEEVFRDVCDWLTGHSSYKRIFGQPPPNDPSEPRAIGRQQEGAIETEIERMDTIITGLGGADDYTELSRYLDGWLCDPETENPCVVKAFGDEIQKLRRFCEEKRIVGDIGGHLVPAHSHREDGEVLQFLSNVNRRLLAARPTDFADVARRHRRSKKGAGVVAIAVGARKARILHSVLSMEDCPISHLVIDTHCALALLNELGVKHLRHYLVDEGDQIRQSYERWSDSTKKLIPLGGG